MQDYWFAKALLPGGWHDDVRIGVSDGRIAAITPGAPPAPDDQRHFAVLPGLANVHSHGFQRGMAGLSERRGHTDDDFWSWRDVMYRFNDRLTPDDIAAITAQAYVEMLETGFTRVGEFHYLHNAPDGAPYTDRAETAAAIAHAARTSGIGLTLLPVFYAHSDFGGAAPHQGQRRFITGIDSFAALFEASRRHLPADANIGIAPHSLRAVTPAELAAIVPLADGGPIHIHIAEQTREVDACVAWSGARPVEWLLANAPVDQRWCLIHATHLTRAECAALAKSGAVAGLCPITEANLGDGTFPAVDYLAAGGRFGIGSDSNIAIDAAAELCALEYSQRLSARKRALLGSEQTPSVGLNLFQGALKGGAQALGVASGLQVGAPADMFTLAADHPVFAGADTATLLDRWIFAGRPGTVDAVWRGGAQVVSGGQHHARAQVATRYRGTLTRLLA